LLTCDTLKMCLYKQSTYVIWLLLLMYSCTYSNTHSAWCALLLSQYNYFISTDLYIILYICVGSMEKVMTQGRSLIPPNDYTFLVSLILFLRFLKFQLFVTLCLLIVTWLITLYWHWLDISRVHWLSDLFHPLLHNMVVLCIRDHENLGLSDQPN